MVRYIAIAKPEIPFHTASEVVQNQAEVSAAWRTISPPGRSPQYSSSPFSLNSSSSAKPFPFNRMTLRHQLVFTSRVYVKTLWSCRQEVETNVPPHRESVPSHLRTLRSR